MSLHDQSGNPKAGIKRKEGWVGRGGSDQVAKCCVEPS